MLLFHLAPLRLAAGSIILPGNYGRMVGIFGWEHPNSHREAILEAVRAQHFPGLPSRLRSVFCVASREDAAIFQAENDGFRYHVLHRVRAAEVGIPIHQTDWRLVNPANTGVVFPNTVWASHYWHGLPQRLDDAGQTERAGSADAPVGAEMAMRSNERREVLVGGPVTIEECLDFG